MLSTYKHDFKRRRTHSISESETEDDEPLQISTSAATIQKTINSMYTIPEHWLS